MIKISVLYVYYNTPKELLASIVSLEKGSKKIRHEIIIVDNNSPRPLPGELKEYPVQIIKNRKNKGFGTALNQAAKKAEGKYLIILNPDTIVPSNFLEKLYQKMESDRKIGLLGVKYKNEKGERLKSVSGIPTWRNALWSFSLLYQIFPNNKSANEYWQTKFDYNKEKEVPAIGGACMTIRRDVFKDVKGFDEQYFMYFEEADLAERIRIKGYKVVYFPSITITHLVGRSTSDKVWIKKTFENSRFRFLKKKEGTIKALISEGIIRFTSPTTLVLGGVLCLASILNLYRIGDLMMFYGDFGRDYLAARDMLLTGQIPLRGIPSSVVWLHQGPLSIYFIGLALLISGFNPAAPAILYSMVGVVSVYLLYKIGSLYFNKKIGLIAALLYATSPLIVINARMPYHTSPIPFFTLLFFITLHKVLNGNRKILPVLFFLFGTLFLLELSNSVLIVVIILSFFISKLKFTKKDFMFSLFGFGIGILPFILFDLRNNFLQTGGFILWVINRVRLFFGVATDNPTSSNILGAMHTLSSEIVRIIFPSIPFIAFIVIVLTIVTIAINARSFFSSQKKYYALILWFIIPVIGFLVHANPGVAYTPVIFPVVILLISFMFFNITRNRKALLIFPVLIACINAVSIPLNNYFLTTKDAATRPALVNYSYGIDYAQRNEVAKKIVTDAQDESFKIVPGGYLNQFKTSIDNYKYLIWYHDGKTDTNSKLIYRIYEDKREIKNISKIIYQTKYVAVTKDE
jgi:GT2 family glycosyltransferase